jgi:hypothetical protein
MELTEPIEKINLQLIDLFGIDTISGDPIWRVVWSETQFEKRSTKYTDCGLELLTPEVRLLPKYRQWIREKFVLERLTIVPTINSDDLPVSPLTYEPVWVFEDGQSNYLPPQTRVAKFVIDGLYAALGKTSLVKYVDEEAKNPIEEREKRLNELQEELFGNETDCGDALAYKEGVSLSGPKFES